MEKQVNKVYLDLDAAVEVFNAKNPDKKIKRSDLAREVGMTYQSAMNYQNGKLPVVFDFIEKIVEFTGITKECLIVNIKK